MNETNHNDNDELSVLDVWNFLRRQYKFIILIFVVLFSLLLIFLFTRPTLYISDVILSINKNIETPDQIKYLHSSRAIIVNPIKNTAIINIASISSDSKDSITALERTIEKIILRQDELLTNRKYQTIKLLETTQSCVKGEFIDLIFESTQQSSAKQLSPITLKTIPYSGLMEKGLWLGLFGSIFLALFVAIGFEFMAKIRKSIKTL